MSTAIGQCVAAFAQALAPQAVVLDVGCGLQPYRSLFSHARYIGIDVEASGRSEHQKVADKVFDGIHIPETDASVDAILCTEVLEHATDPVALVAEMFRVLKPGGRICITVPFIWGLHELPYDFRRYTPNGLSRLFVDSGFVVDIQENLTEGIDAIQMIISSELNNYRVNIRPHTVSKMEGWRFRLALYMHTRLMRILEKVWRRHFRFERIYIDNYLLAHKPEHNSPIS